MLRFLGKILLLSVSTIMVTWFLEGAFYTYTYISTSAQEYAASEASMASETSGLVLPKPTVFLPAIRETNILLLGMAGQPYAAPDLTDTIIVGMVRKNPTRLTLVSIPRDLFVQVPNGDFALRINSLYVLGKSFSPLDPYQFIKEKVEEISGLSLDYYASINIQGLERFIDALGGVTLEVKEPIYDPLFPGPNYSYEPFYLEAGTHHLDGRTAIRFARSRHAPRGDFERIARQHDLLLALGQKVKEQGISVDNAKELFDTMEGHFVGDITVKDIPFLVNTLAQLSEGSLRSFTLDNSPQGLLASHKTDEGASVFIPKAGFENYSEIREFFAHVVNE